MTSVLARPPASTARPYPAAAGEREALVVRMALGAIAIAVLDDAFVHREPGTSMLGHLASGLVPVAVAFVLAAAYPSRRPGVRAVIALVCGSVTAVAGAVDGLRHVLIDRLAGDDVTALLASAAGALLVAVGIAVLWRSRRLDEPPLRRYGRRALVAFAGSSPPIS